MYMSVFKEIADPSTTKIICKSTCVKMESRKNVRNNKGESK